MSDSTTSGRDPRWRWGRPRNEPTAASVPGGGTWDEQYATGRWDYLGEISELSRYSVLVGYMAHFRPGGAVLDIGCGAGVLFSHLAPRGYARYVGVDIAPNAIATLNEQQHPRTTFIATDGEHYVPEGQFDLIVCNEVLYFFHDARAAVARYAQSLAPSGVLLVSTCTAFHRAMPLLDGLKADYQTLDETRVTHGANEWSWIISVLAPRKP